MSLQQVPSVIDRAVILPEGLDKVGLPVVQGEKVFLMVTERFSFNVVEWRASVPC